ncbi:DciA family protein [Myxacorys almedinensis]|uniref:DUF721 domain-containing protein n=1 Tax=Myxacorys almedinensis A TaxID=2690445 RepID=A0A8J7Z299_9CYAN|nr:DciA family protein [Myxacorys almedinensis]NDJ16861.1 DUF721 domain-containing protein [Myxacorys almedinensis A]
MLNLRQLFQAYELPQSQEQQQLQQILGYWMPCVGEAVSSQVSGKAIAQHTRPLSVQRGILQVAVSSPVWSHTLLFERPKILQKLNDRLTTPIKDIRFSTAQWHQQPLPALPAESVTVWSDHPSRQEATASSHLSAQLCLTPETAFEQWLEKVRQRSQHLPPCPQCQCPTPLGELERWGVCSLCSAQRLS